MIGSLGMDVNTRSERCLTVAAAPLADTQSLPQVSDETYGVVLSIKAAITLHPLFSTAFITSRITIRFTEPCRGAVLTHGGRVWLWDVSLPSPCQSIVQLKYTTATQPWTTLKEPLLHCLLHLNTLSTLDSLSVVEHLQSEKHFPVLCCHSKA